MSKPIHSNGDSSTLAMIFPKPLPQPAAIELVNSVSFCHPGYHAPANVLFTLSQVDDLTTSLKGVHHGTALTACKIIANNATNGYLTKDREGRHRVDQNPDYVLTKSKYWFFAGPEHDTIYPVVPSFQDWEFPHGSPLINWLKPGGTTAADASEHRCVITRTAELVHPTHLIPLADEQWFEKNAMHQYGDQSRSDIDQTGNTTTLRHDLHYASDDNWFSIIPKQNCYVIHQFHATTAGRTEFAAKYHNIPISHGFENVAPEFLFARFARSVLMLAKAFIASSPVSRHIARFSVMDNGSAEG
ncbi:hypothetical protein F4680DRAFT_470236 [Xylaria scruposa]|nr:hypothetical protein F4680DRAFT_470236 [Xylaria scruposa]